MMSRILKTDLRRAFSFNFLFVMLGTVCVQLLCMLDYFGYKLDSVVYLFDSDGKHWEIHRAYAVGRMSGICGRVCGGRAQRLHKV